MTNTKSKKETLPPGLYFIGDPTYLGLSEKDFNQVWWGEDGVLTSEGGEQFAKFDIGADGFYGDNDGFEYGVDSAHIGAYPITSVDEVDTALGRCVEFSEEVTVAFDEELGLVRFGEIEIELANVALLGEPLIRPEGMSDLDWLRELAKAGDSEARYELYEELANDPETHKEAIKWMFAAARGGDPIAQYDAGCLREHGEDHQKHLPDAVRWYRLSAEQDYAPAQEALGLCYYFGLGVESNDEEAAKWLHPAAAYDFLPTAQRILGELYGYGWGVEQSDEKAIYWFERAIKNGDEPTTLLAAAFYIGWGRAPAAERNIHRAFTLLLTTLDSLGPEDDFILQDSRDLFIDGANEFLATDAGEEEPDEDLFLLADADFDDLAAFCYEHGLGVEKDLKRAEEIRENGL